MSTRARLFDQFWLYNSPVKAAGSGSNKGTEAKGSESFAAGADLFSGI
jgi:hypothetical protein